MPLSSLKAVAGQPCEAGPLARAGRPRPAAPPWDQLPGQADARPGGRARTGASAPQFMSPLFWLKLSIRFRNYGHVFGNRSLTVAALTRTFDPDANMPEFGKEPRVRAATVKERLPWNTLLNFRHWVLSDTAHECVRHDALGCAA